MKRYDGVVSLDGWVDGFCRWCWAWVAEVVSPVARGGERSGGWRFCFVGSLVADVSCCCRRPQFGTYSISQERSTGENKNSLNWRQQQRGNWTDFVGWDGFFGHF